MNIKVTLTNKNAVSKVYQFANTNITATATLVECKYTLTILNTIILTKAVAANRLNFYTRNSLA